MNAKPLERAAIEAHRRGERWETFWEQHGDNVHRVEPYDRQRYHRLVRRLLALVTAGDCDGMEPVGNGLPQWEVDDAKQSDTRTQSRCLLPLASPPSLGPVA